MSKPPVTINLSQPIAMNGAPDITTLTLREPTGLDLAQFGVPTTPDGKCDAGAINQLISALSGVHPEVLGKLCGGDWFIASQVIIGFLAPTRPDFLSGTSTLPGSSATPLTTS